MRNNKKSPALVIVGICIAIFGLISFIQAISNTGKKSTDKMAVIVDSSGEVVVKDIDEDTDNESKEEIELDDILPRDEFIATCEELSYKDVMRNPDDYIGKNFYATVMIDAATTGKELEPGKAHCDGYVLGWNDTRNEYDLDFNRSISLSDYQNTESDDYLKMLEDDIVIVYGTFTGLSGSKNVITGEMDYEMALNVYYVDLVEE